jgi:hypothetical protein
MCGWDYTATGVRKVGFGDANSKDLFEDNFQFSGCVRTVFDLLKPPVCVMHQQV